MITQVRIGTIPPFYDICSLLLCKKFIDPSIVLKNHFKVFDAHVDLISLKITSGVAHIFWYVCNRE
jgi:hypothetical protein